MTTRSRTVPSICVLMPVHNEERFCAEAIESILNQTYGAFEFIIVNDGSTDGSLEILRHYAQRDARICLIDLPENCGLSNCLNLGLARARADLIARMDADDVALPHRLQAQLAFFEQHPSIQVAGSSQLHMDIDGSNERLNVSLTDVAEVRETLVSRNAIAHSTVMMRREPIIGLGGYRPAFDLAEDYDLWLRVSEKADIANMPDALMRVRRHPGNTNIYAGDRQEFLAQVARYCGMLRRRGQGDPFNNTDVYSDVAMMDMMELSEEEKMVFRVEILRSRNRRKGR
jgi:glycosyltransferase involved in cell wall biosynthesis